MRAVVYRGSGVLGVRPPQGGGESFNAGNAHNTGAQASEVVGGGGVLIVMHGRSRISIDVRIRTLPGRSTSGFFTKEDIDVTKRGAPREVFV